MKLENDTIVIESRSEIAVLQDMLALYLASGKAGDTAELETIKEQLDVLYMTW